MDEIMTKSAKVLFEGACAWTRTEGTFELWRVSMKRRVSLKVTWHWETLVANESATQEPSGPIHGGKHKITCRARK